MGGFFDGSRRRIVALAIVGSGFFIRGVLSTIDCLFHRFAPLLLGRSALVIFLFGTWRQRFAATNSTSLVVAVVLPFPFLIAPLQEFLFVVLALELFEIAFQGTFFGTKRQYSRGQFLFELDGAFPQSIALYLGNAQRALLAFGIVSTPGGQHVGGGSNDRLAGRIFLHDWFL